MICIYSLYHKNGVIATDTHMHTILVPDVDTWQETSNNNSFVTNIRIYRIYSL